MSAAEYGWVIESERSPVFAPLYLEFVSEMYQPTDGPAKRIEGWAWDMNNLKAARFSRREDAEKFWRCVLGRDLAEIRIAEHGWG